LHPLQVEAAREVPGREKDKADRMTRNWKIHLYLQVIALFIIVMESMHTALMEVIRLGMGPEDRPGLYLLVTFLSVIQAIRVTQWWIDREKRLLMEQIKRMHGRES
jgi:hypothetical protein